LPMKERLRFASTCKHLNELEKKSDGRNIDVVRLLRYPSFVMKIGNNTIDTDIYGRHPFFDFTTFFKNAHISYLYTTNAISSWSSGGDCPTLPIFESSTFSFWEVSTSLTSANRTPENRFIVPLANSRAFTRNSLSVEYLTSNKDPLEDKEFFLNLPCTRYFRLYFYRSYVDESVCPFVEALKRLVDRAEDFLLHIQMTETPHQIARHIQDRPKFFRPQESRTERLSDTR
ncbi:hypothetical protein PFISCL1PPCAC_4942, partial [Pristionchus fissidentatus]